MKHYLLTRFNLKYDNSTPNEIEIALSEVWLNHRFHLFETYCLPSVVAQNNKNFVWLIIFDINTPLKFKDRITASTKQFQFIEIVYLAGFKNLVTGLKNHIVSHIAPEQSFILTTRLDNDDIIHQDFIDQIQQLAISSANTVVDLVNGYQLSLKKNDRYTIRKYGFHLNPFVSLIESFNDFQTVLARPHSDWNSAHIIAYTKRRLWMELVHDRNLANYEKFFLPLTRDIDLVNFKLMSTPLRYGIIKIWFYNLIALPLNFSYKIYRFLKRS